MRTVPALLMQARIRRVPATSTGVCLMPATCRTQLSRRAALAAAAAALASRRAAAQDDAAITSAGESPPIVSTGRGEAPTYGGRRPGPLAWPDPPAEREAGVAPTGLRIEQAGVDAAVEALTVADGQMPDPTGPWVVAWYDNLGRLGAGGNVVMAGHVDYWNVGPSVFYGISALQPGDAIEVLGGDGQAYRYAVDRVEQFDAATIDMDAVVGPTGSDTLTLITCGGAFDYATGEYLQRTAVRSNRVR